MSSSLSFAFANLVRASTASAALLLAMPAQSGAPAAPAATQDAGPSYAQLARLAEGADLVLAARVLKQAIVPADRAPGLRRGFARLYLQAETLSVLAGKVEAPTRFAYLADLPMDPKGRAPKLKKQEMLLFARLVSGRSGELQLVAPDAQLSSSTDLQARLRTIVAAFAAKDAPPRVSGIRDVLSTAGNLAGESETQIFLATADDRPAALTVIRRPGMAPSWGASWGELVDQAAQAPARDTLAWYRLACGLPGTLPAAAVTSGEPADRERAATDYRFVIEQLGPCTANPR